jgi:REP element-mobilizing transposase RayT
MKYDLTKHRRRSIRLKEFDYSQPGSYFVTIVSRNRELLFGEVWDDKLRLNDAGRFVHAAWCDLPNHFTGVSLDAFVVMPNHVHGIIELHDDTSNRAGLKPAPTKSRPRLFQLVRAFKTFSARYVNKLRGTQGAAVWQRNYYEHVVRVEKELDRIREYIVNNPAQWEQDRENPERTVNLAPQHSETWKV